MNKKLNTQTFKLDSATYIIIRYFAFAAASCISALLNIILFASLDTSSKPFLIGFSLTLELAKLISVVSMGVLSELNGKLKTVSLAAKHKFYMTLYFVYAVLSITASLGFSTMITSRTEATRNLALETMQSQVIEIEAQNNKIQDIINVRDLPQSEYIAEYQSKYEAADANYREADLAYANARANLQRFTKTDENIDQYNQLASEVQAALTLRSTLDRARTEAERNRNTATAEYESNHRNAETNLKDAEAELALMVAAAGIETDRPRAAITELKLKLSAMEAENIRNMGMQFVFVTWGSLLRVAPQTIKFIILLIISLLLELTIFQTAPDIRITRRVLFFFRNSLPKDLNIQEFVDQLDEENNKFNDRSNDKFSDTDNKEELVPATPEIEEMNKLIAKTAAEVEKEFPVQMISKDDPVEVNFGVVPEKKKRKPRARKEKVLPENIMEKLVEIATEPPESLIETKKEKKPRKPRAKKVKPIDQETETAIQNNVDEDLNKMAAENNTIDTAVHDELVAENNHSLKINKQNKPAELFQFRFGRASNLIKETIVKFVKECCGNRPGPFIISPSEAALKLSINDRSRDVFLDKLAKLTIGRKPIIYNDGFNNWASNFGADEIIEYITQIIAS